MPEILLSLATASVVVWALVELVQTDRAKVRTLPKAAWGVIIVLLAPFGPVAWFWLGRPRTAPASLMSGEYRPSPLRSRRYVSRPAPDDDPEFLALLNARADQQRRLRRMEEDFGPREPGEPDAPRE